MRARLADAEGFIEHDGVKIHFEVHGDGGPTILLMPTWTLVHKRIWKMQLPYLARHFRVVTYDGPGNGRSDRPLTPPAYGQAAQVAYALAVLDATGTGRAVVVALSRAVNWALELAAEHPGRVHGMVAIGASIALTAPGQARAASGGLDDPPALDLPPSAVPRLGTDPASHWRKYNRRYWHEHHDDFAWFFMGQCFGEPHSTKAVEDGVGWALETTGAVLDVESQADRPDRDTLESWCARLTSPLLVLHGSADQVVPLARSEALAELTGGDLVVLEGGGHIPIARDPVQVNLLVRDFADRFRPPAPTRTVWSRWQSRPQRVLYLSSPIGLGHARRDLAIAAKLRELRPGVQLDWLTQDPVTRMLADAGERVHPASRFLVNESAHVESESGEHDLHCFEALRRMDEILVANFMVFHDLLAAERYDLVVGDEAWDVDHFLHENPELKRSAYAWLTDFVGFLPMPSGGEREALVAADYNAEMIGHIARYPRLRDRSIFVGDIGDVVDERFGPDLPYIQDWTSAHYDFVGYVTGAEQPAPDEGSRAAMRAALGYRADERVCVVTVGGSGVGGHLLRLVAAAFPEAARRVPGLRMILVAGPRIDPASVPAPPGLEVLPYVPSLDRHLAACDLAVVQGGLTTCMELTAAGRPFIYVPLRNHFEQQFHVTHRLRRHGAGRRMDYDTLTPDALAAAIAEEIDRPVTYLPVPGDGAARAAALLAELF
ncbi:alpha/beta fold hydrolase [Dactylosporangium sp. NBC_01737]|uniref:alpha/beta fold hydrolase n=1 Tax=Dactylosporangium sp. NBC_01737 TaxID=2975959 RepID=UPI002E1608AD|nr:alpha/beta fold hydrolase [Dactylosporangium sp. NBC_01737]